MSEARLQLANEWEQRAREYRAKVEMLLPNRAGDAEAESLLGLARAYETCAEELRGVAAGAGDRHFMLLHREESIMAEKCELHPSGAHHYVAVVEQEVRTTTGETTTATYTQVIFCVQCGHKL